MLFTESQKISVHQPTLETYYRKFAGALKLLIQHEFKDLESLLEMPSQNLVAKFTPAAVHRIGIMNAAMGQVTESVAYILEHKEGVVAGTNDMASRLVANAIQTGQPESYLNAVIDAVGVKCEKAERGPLSCDAVTSFKIVSNLVNALTTPMPSGNAAFSMGGAGIAELASIKKAAEETRTLFVKVAGMIVDEFFEAPPGQAIKH